MNDRISIDELQATGELAAQGVDKYIAALRHNDAVSLIDFVPAGSRPRRRLILIELIKIDLKHRLIRKRELIRVEHYLEQFSELRVGGPPVDLLIEEYQLRQALGEKVELADYIQRFPEHASSLARMAGTQKQTMREHLEVRRELTTFQIGDVVGEFRIQRLLGRGAFAHVYLAWQTTLQRSVALKVARNRGTEPQTLAQLDHPHIIRVFDLRIVPEKELSLLSMKFVAGGTLDDVIEWIKQLPQSQWNGATFLAAIDSAVQGNEVESVGESDLRRQLRTMTWPQIVCWLGARVAAALEHAHRLGVLHRDIKPANILLTPNGEPQLADFNVSSSQFIEPAPKSIFGGSLPFMSPEQLEVMEQSRSAEEIDARSDIYSLGMTLWKLLAGERPFNEKHTGDYFDTLSNLIAVRREGPQATADVGLPADTPPALVHTLRRCLAGRPEDRFSSAGELASALELCLHPETKAILESEPRGPVSWVRRFPIMAMLPMGLAPNIVASLLNIRYNESAVINARPDVRPTFEMLMIVFNVILFPMALFAFCWVAWPVSRCVNRARRHQSLSETELSQGRQRCLKLGNYASWICVGAWIVAGFLWPLSLDLLSGWLPWEAHLHFLISLTLCGLIAAVYPFFLVSYLSLRGLLPVLLRVAKPPSDEISKINDVAKALGPNLLAAAAVPLVGIATLVMIESHDRPTMKALVAFGLIGCVFAYFLERRIRRDLAALSIIYELKR